MISAAETFLSSNTSRVRLSGGRGNPQLQVHAEGGLARQLGAGRIGRDGGSSRSC